MKREQASMQVRNYLRALAMRGELKPGDRLPTERQLARDLSISRTSLREGIVQLTTFGVLRSVHGVGTFVAADLHYGSLEALTEFYSFPVRQMLETRLALEPQIAALAAKRASRQQIAGLIEEVERACKTAIAPDQYHVHDIRFHQMVANACGNPILKGLIEAVTASTIVDDARKPNFDFARSTEMHRKICNAIRSRDKAGARVAMEQHLRLSSIALATETSEV